MQTFRAEDSLLAFVSLLWIASPSLKSSCWPVMPNLSFWLWWGFVFHYLCYDVSSKGCSYWKHTTPDALSSSVYTSFSDRVDFARVSHPKEPSTQTCLIYTKCRNVHFKFIHYKLDRRKDAKRRSKMCDVCDQTVEGLYFVTVNGSFEDIDWKHINCHR